MVHFNLDEQLLKDVDVAIEKSTFRNRTHLIEYLLQRFAYEKKYKQYKDLILYVTILLGFALTIVVFILMR